jgi:hypothetical protein
MLLEFFIGLGGVIVLGGTAPIWRMWLFRSMQSWNKRDAVTRAMERDQELAELQHRTVVAFATSAATVAEANAKIIHDRAIKEIESDAPALLALGTSAPLPGQQMQPGMQYRSPIGTVFAGVPGIVHAETVEYEPPFLRAQRLATRVAASHAAYEAAREQAISEHNDRNAYSQAMEGTQP